MYYNNKFQIGDIIRSKEDKSIVYHINKIEYKSDIDRSGRYDEEYWWVEYELDDGTIIKDYDDHKYELISKEIGPNQIKEYDKILVNKGEGLEGRRYWMCDFAAGWTNENPYYEKRLMTIIQPNVKEIYYNILPYNNETKKLIGTNYSIPIYYHYQIWVESRIKDIKENPDNWNAIDDIILNIKYN